MLLLETCEVATAGPSIVFQVKEFAETMKLGHQSLRLLSNCGSRRIQRFDRTLNVLIEERTGRIKVCVANDISKIPGCFQLGVSRRISCLQFGQYT